MWEMIATGVVGFFGLFIATFVAFKTFYRKTSANEAFVRTGVGGNRVVMDGGAFVVGFLHEVKWISLETLRLQVERSEKGALITKDNLRMDVTVDFFIRVQPDRESIMQSARSLGDRSLSPDSIKDLMEAKLVGALRDTAAQRNLLEIHLHREDFAEQVQNFLRPELRQNGLLLEGVSIVNLDQTDKQHLDPNNLFDAEALRYITNVTATKGVEKNLIERKAEVERKEQDTTAFKQKLDFDRDQEFASASQTREIESYRAEQEAQTASFKLEQELNVRRKQEETQRGGEQARIVREQAVEQTQVEKELAIERSKRDRDIGIIEKEKEREARDAEKLVVVAQRERAAQEVHTVEATAGAEREKQVVIIQQQAESERDKIKKQIAADAAAYEVAKQAEAEARAAEQRATAIERLAAARLTEAQAQAEGERQLIAAKNTISRDVLVQQAVLQALETAPTVVHELMKPAEKISDIKVLNVAGMGGGNGSGAIDGGANRVVSAFLQAGAALPMFKEMLRFAGVDTDANSLGDLARKAVRGLPGFEKVAEVVPEEVRSEAGRPGDGRKPRIEMPERTRQG
ncbi:MAG: hypothetical protein HY722_03290 [Planctomycetes bacterium]|nr:hypothetical protein [Planctomycetota bacterium]